MDTERWWTDRQMERQTPKRENKISHHYHVGWYDDVWQSLFISCFISKIKNHCLNDIWNPCWCITFVSVKQFTTASMYSCNDTCSTSLASSLSIALVAVVTHFCTFLTVSFTSILARTEILVNNTTGQTYNSTSTCVFFLFFLFVFF